MLKPQLNLFKINKSEILTYKNKNRVQEVLFRHQGQAQ